MTPIVILHAGRHLELVKNGTWEYVRRPNATAVVSIVAVNARNELILVEQPRIPVSASVIELPAGLVGDEQGDEDLLDAARREMEEETGFAAALIRILSRGPSSSGLTSEIVTLVKAEGLTQVGAGGGVAGEQITVHLVPLPQVSAWLADKAQRGCLIDHKVWAGLWFSLYSGTTNV
jgi:ADP-ribose pyrophosphatase